MTTSSNPLQEAGATELHKKMFENTKPRLEYQAWYQITVCDRKYYEIVVLCIQVYSQWRYLADIFFPEHNWQLDRDKGIDDPLAIASVIGWDICGVITRRCPSITVHALALPPEGLVKAFILSDDGATVHYIKPEIT